MAKFKVGNFVKGNELSDKHYGITNSKMKKAAVVYINKEETKMELLIVEHENKNEIAKKFTVTHFECFDLWNPDCPGMKVSEVKAGDKIKIKSWPEIQETLNEISEDCHNRFFNSETMSVFCNRVLDVDEVKFGLTGQYVYAGGWAWFPEWFDVVTEDTTCSEMPASETVPSNGKEKIEIEVDLNFPEEAYHKAHHVVEEKIKAYRKSKKKWTEEEIQEAQRLSEEMVLELYRKRIFPVFYIMKEKYPDRNKIKLVLSFGVPGGPDKNFSSQPVGDDIYNETIGLCVCLCKATGRKIPDFILRK